MGPENEIQILSACYELVHNSSLMQGDILIDCPIFIPPPDMNISMSGDIEDAEFDVGTQDVVILSQSCDLVPGQKGDIWLVILCPIWKISDLSAKNSFLNSSYGKEMCRRGHVSGYHMIHGCEHEQFSREISIVSFKDIYSLPLNFIRSFVEKTGNHPRVRSPYREHLAQAFARFFMRVGLPVDIESFSGDKDLEKVMKKLDSMNEAQRKRIFQAFE